MRSLQIRIVFLILFITAINFFDRNAISFAILPIEHDLGLNSAQFGYIAAAWGIGYMIMVFFEGMLIDRWGSVKIWGAGAVIWSLITLIMSQASSFAIFFALRLLLGMAEGVHFPALTKTVADWMTPHWRCRCMSLTLLGVPISSVIGAPFLTFLIERATWRNMFLILGALGFVWSVLWMVNFRGKKNPHLSSVEVGIQPNGRWLKAFFTTPSLLINCFVFFMFGYVLFFGLVWLPGYFEKMHGTSLNETGFLVILPWSVSALFLLASGWISDHLWKRTRSLRVSRTYLIAVGMILASLSFFLIPFSDNLWFDLILISLGLGFSFLANPPIFSLAADLFPRSVGMGQAIHSFFFAMSGVVSPALTGFLVHETGDFDSAIYFVSGLSLLAGALAFCFQHPKENFS